MMSNVARNGDARLTSVKYRNVTREEVKEKMAQHMRQTRDKQRAAAMEFRRTMAHDQCVEKGDASRYERIREDNDEAEDCSLTATTTACTTANSSCGEPPAHVFTNQYHADYGCSTFQPTSPAFSPTSGHFSPAQTRTETEARHEVLSNVCCDYGFDPSDEETLNFLLSIEAELLAEELFAHHSHACELDDPELEYMYYMAQANHQ